MAEWSCSGLQIRLRRFDSDLSLQNSIQEIINEMKKIVVSGGFDPVHIGHLQMLEEAKLLGDHLTVILNSDKFLKEKKLMIFLKKVSKVS